MSLPLSKCLRMSPHPFPQTHLAGSSSQANVIDLAYVERTTPSSADDDGPPPPPPPTTLFVHGLDSSSHTWRGVQRSLSTPSVAIDCRGCGRSALGDPASFSPDAVVDDVKRLVDAHPLLGGGRRFVLVGHSMGGRVGMCYAARYPEDVAALVVEDMDVRRRPVESNVIPMDVAMAIAFERKFDDDGGGVESVLAAFRDVGYPADMVGRWIDEGRIYPIDTIEEEGGTTSEGGFWSDVNPAFRALCYRHFFDSDSGEEAWKKISQQKDGTGKSSFPVCLMVAGMEGTVCDEESIARMVDAMGDRLTVKRYPAGTHSIHNSVREDFMADLGEIIENVIVAANSS